MAYVKQTWVDNVTVIDAAKLNHMEDGIASYQVGPEGPQGMDGDAATVTVGTTTTTAAGTEAKVTNAGTDSAAVLNFEIPKGADGAAGPAGPKGDTGDAGADGAAATVAVGTVTTGAAGSDAAVTNSGTTSAAVLDFAIPKGEDGVTPSVTIGTTTTGEAGTNAQVTNDGTAPNVVLNFVIPKGEKGDTGAAGAEGAQGPKGDTGAAGVSITAIALTTDVDGKVTGGTATMSDSSTVTITVTQA